MKVNNLELILKHLVFDELVKNKKQDTFYHLQILQRKKEHKNLKSNSVCVKTYYIDSKDKLITVMPTIITLCDALNARAYINLNAKSFETATFKTIEKISNQLCNRDYTHTKNAYESVVGTLTTKSNYSKYWLLDIDVQDFSLVNDIKNNIDENFNNKICIDIIPTKNGFHLITKPFDIRFLDELEYKFSTKIDFHKNNHTILYI